jgi:ketosteroid isomerase-like protein
MLDFAIERGAIMSGNLPVNTMLAFLEQINARNVHGLCASMTDDHVFLDGLGNRMQGGESMRKGWAVNVACFLTIECHTRTFFSQGDVVAAFGSAEGTLAVKGELPKENHWSASPAWRAVVRDGLIAEWQVYADNQRARKTMGVQNP